MSARLNFALITLSLVVSTVLVLVQHTAAEEGNTVTTSASFPFSGDFFDTDTQETVDISGTVHIVTRVTTVESETSRLWGEGKNDTLRLEATIRNAFGTGRTSGRRYKATGSSHIKVTFPPGEFPSHPTLPAIGFPVFPLQPNCDKCRGQDPLFLTLNLVFAGNGTLLVGPSAINVGGD
jgi:hypothetical protein